MYYETLFSAGLLRNTGIFLLKNPYARPSASAMFRKSPACDEFRNSTLVRTNCTVDKMTWLEKIVVVQLTHA